MSKDKEALGKGIRALLAGIDDEINSKKSMPVSSDQPKSGIIKIALSNIEINPFQPRVNFDESSLEELSASIKVHGVIQPVTVRQLPGGRYQLIAGERRLRASKLAGLKEVPAFIRSANDQETLEIALIENIHREDLNAIEIGINYKRLIDECTLSHDELAERVGKKRATVTNYLRLLKLPPDIQVALKRNIISMGHAKALLSLDDPIHQLSYYKEVVKKGLSVRQTEELTRQQKKAERKKPVKPTIPYEMRKLQDDLSSHLSTNVKIKENKDGKGEIVITFYTESDLDRLYQSILKE